MKKELFEELLESIEKLKDAQRIDLFGELLKSIKDKSFALEDIFWDNYEIMQDFCSKHADLSDVHNKKDFLSAIGFDYYKTKNEFIEYMSDLYNYLY